ncbi:MAG: carboxypeptidase regulatory-like domain-containing protein, partial [Planctomycetota bacterium]
SAPVRGRVVDGSGEPLAQYPLWLSGGGGRRESITTDEGGRFEGRLARRAGPVEIQLLGDRRGWPPESPRLERRHEVTEQGAVELTLEANPAAVLTVQLRVDPNQPLPASLDDVRCTLLAIDGSWPQADRAFLGTNYVGQPERVPDDERVLYRVWMNDLLDLESRPEPWLVRVEPIDGGWVAEGAFDAADLEDGDPVLASVRPTGAVALTLLDGNGTPVQSEPVRLLADAAGEPREPFTSGMYRRPRETDASGGEVWLGLDPGTYSLAVEGIHFEPAQRSLEVVAGERTECTVTLESRAGGGRLVIQVQSESGIRRHAMFWLYSRDDPKNPLTSQGAVWREEGARRVGEAHFDGLEPGEYKVRLVSTSGIPGEPLSMLTTVEADATTTVDFHFKDGSTAPLAVVARDARSGRVLDDWRLVLGDGQWFLDSDLREVEGADGRKLVARRVPATSTASGSVAWLIADGFAAQAIELSAGTVIDTEGTRLHVVDLDPGWGKLLVVKDPDEMPLEGVGVYLDGSHAGHTDSMGRLLLSGPAKPERIRFELDGYEIRSSVVRSSDDLYLGSSQVALFGSGHPL